MSEVHTRETLEQQLSETLAELQAVKDDRDWYKRRMDSHIDIADLERTKRLAMEAERDSLLSRVERMREAASKVGPAYGHLQTQQEGYRNGSASISECIAAGDDFHKALNDLHALLSDTTEPKEKER